MSISKVDRACLREILSNSLAVLFERGYRWTLFEFTPFVRKLTRQVATENDRDLLAHAHCMIGDLWDVAHATGAAYRAYKQAIRLQPKDSYAWREAGVVAESQGRLKLADRHLKQALKLNPNDWWAKSFLRDIPVLEGHRPGRIESEVPDLLAKGKARAAYEIARHARRPDDRVWRLCALSVGEATDAQVLASMRRFLQLKQRFFFDSCLRFYMRRSLFDSAEWQQLRECNRQTTSAI